MARKDGKKLLERIRSTSIGGSGSGEQRDLEIAG
jgi:hypothetical protein